MMSRYTRRIELCDYIVYMMWGGTVELEEIEKAIQKVNLPV